MKSAATQTALEVGTLQRALLSWYDANKRMLPWRRTSDPYAIWVSEVMLQQTRVAAVTNYYSEFLRRFPSVVSLAAASEQDVLAAWSGLGYYRRARMLHLAAHHIVKHREGTLPTRHAEWLELPGIGKYTAAAISSIAFGVPVAAVDGNAERVLLRLSGKPLSNADCWGEAQRLLDYERPGDFNQAMMELGATVCLPQAPHCEECPLEQFCQTRGEHVTGARPQRERGELHYALMRRADEIRLVQRAATERLMAGMWELPAATRKAADPLLRLRHAITNTDYQVLVHEITSAKGKWVRVKDAAKLPLTGVTRKVLRALRLLQ